MLELKRFHWLAAGLIAIAPPFAMAQATNPIRVGFICPFSGASQDFGNSARLGVELAVEEINEVGGYLGRKIELVPRDDQGDPERGREAAEDLVLKSKVDFTVGFCNTGVALGALDVFQAHKHLLMIPVATGSTLSVQYAPARSYIFRMAAKDSLQASFLVDDIVKRGYTKVAVFSDTTGYGAGGGQEVENLLAAKQLQRVYSARFDVGDRDLVRLMVNAKAAGAQAIIGYSIGTELAALARARNEAGFSAPLYGPWEMSSRIVPDKAHGAADGAMMAQTIIPDVSNERRLSFIARLKRHAASTRIDSLMAAAQSYDAVHLMLRAVFQAKGSTGGDDLRQALESLQRPYVGVVTTYDRPFSSSDHDAFSGNMIWLGVWRGGEIRFAYAEDAKRSSYVRRKASEVAPTR